MCEDAQATREEEPKSILRCARRAKRGGGPTKATIKCTARHRGRSKSRKHEYQSNDEPKSANRIERKRIQSTQMGIRNTRNQAYAKKPEERGRRARSAYTTSTKIDLNSMTMRRARLREMVTRRRKYDLTLGIAYADGAWGRGGVLSSIATESIASRRATAASPCRDGSLAPRRTSGYRLSFWWA